MPYDFSFFCSAYNINNIFISTCGAYLEVVFEFEVFWFSEGQSHFHTSWHVKMSLALNEPIWDVLY